MPRRRNPLGMWLLTSLCLLFAHLTRLLPLPVARVLGRGLATLAYYMVPRIKRVGLANLDLAYDDELTRREKDRILKASVKSVGIVAAEFTRIPLLADDAFFNRWVRVEGVEHVARDRGAIFIGAHLGNWEWLAGAFATMGYQTAGVVRPLRDPRLNAFIDRVRSANGVKTIEKAQAGNEILKLLRDGWCVGVLADQNPHESAVPASFFGMETWGTAAPAILAARAKVPVHMACAVRQPDGAYLFRISPPLELTTGGNARANLLENSQRCQDAIEALVREHPEQWLWMHRRWKPRPRFEEEWAKKRERANAATEDQS